MWRRIKHKLENTFYALLSTILLLWLFWTERRVDEEEVPHE